MSSTTCRRPGCTGTIEDGYCNVCGLAPAAGTPAPVPTAPTMPASPAPAAPAVRARTGTTGTSATSATSSTRGTMSSRTTSRSTSTHSRIGAGLVRVPPQPSVDPAAAVLPVAEVPEDKRFCSNCGEPVGRSHNGRPGRAEGFCGSCGRRFDFVPKLAAGDLVNGQYAVVGCVAHGGLGWIYLARDRHVADRWVVLKGLLDTGDAEARRTAVKEREFLAAVEHPNIVKIFNFVEHDGAGYIVMEYVGGTSLKTMLKERMVANGGHADPLPVSVAIAYLLGILPAYVYLHERGYAYCDFKPDNLIQQGDDVKLIDLGGVRHVSDTDAVIYGTVGFQAPEIADVGPSPSSDLYTIGRTLAVLVMDFKGYQRTYQHSLPAADEQPVLARYPALHRFLLRATANEPGARFQTADEMGAQLLGVLRQVVAIDGVEMRPAPSTLFGADRTVVVDDDDVTDEADHRVLPMLRMDSDDPSAAFLAATDVSDPARLAASIGQAVDARFIGETPETHLRLARALLDAGDLAGTVGELGRYDAPGADWRTRWLLGITALAERRPVDAAPLFGDVMHWLPGELAPQVALGQAYEALDEPADALALYDVVRRTDPSWVAATLGEARCYVLLDDAPKALEAFRAVARGTRAHTDAQLALARALVHGRGATPPTAEHLREADGVLAGLSLDPGRRARTALHVYGELLGWLRSGRLAPNPQLAFLEHPVTEPGVRRGLEEAYRRLARLTTDDTERARLVDDANAIRPWTLV